jgi:hypothetical protein
VLVTKSPPEPEERAAAARCPDHVSAPTEIINILNAKRKRIGKNGNLERNPAKRWE